MNRDQFVLETQAALLIAQLGLSSRCEALQKYTQGQTLDSIIQLWKEQAHPELRGLLEKFNPQKEIMECAAQKIELICITEPAYPELLRNISDPPFVLYARGQTEFLHDLAIA